MPREIKKWTQADEFFMRYYYEEEDNEWMAEMLERSVTSIVHKARMMCLKKTPQRRSEANRQNQTAHRRTWGGKTNG